eukprot:179482-Prymnesium_polylepis.1
MFVSPGFAVGPRADTRVGAMPQSRRWARAAYQPHTPDTRVGAMPQSRRWARDVSQPHSKST